MHAILPKICTSSGCALLVASVMPVTPSQSGLQQDSQHPLLPQRPLLLRRSQSEQSHCHACTDVSMKQCPWLTMVPAGLFTAPRVHNPFTKAAYERLYQLQHQNWTGLQARRCSSRQIGQMTGGTADKQYLLETRWEGMRGPGTAMAAAVTDSGLRLRPPSAQRWAA